MFHLHLLNPSTNNDIYVDTSRNCTFFPDDLYGCDTACYDYRLLWNSLWVETSTLAYEAKIFLAQKVSQLRSLTINFRKI